MFQAISSGTALMKQSLRVLAHHPEFLLPLLFCWLVYAPLLIYLKFYLPWHQFDAGTSLAIGFGVIFFMSFILSLSCLVVLEMIQQVGEDRWPLAAMKRGLLALHTHLAEFAAGFVLTKLAALIVFLPPSLLFFLTKRFHLTLADGVWFVVIIYCAFAWSFTLFIEQMFAAELYLWHLKWLKACELATDRKEKCPKFRDIEPPSLLDETSELVAPVERPGWAK